MARREGRAALVRARRGPLRAGPARRALLRDRERPGRLHRPQAGQGDLDRGGRRRHLHRRHRDLHGRAGHGGVRRGRGDRHHRLRPRGAARDAGGQAGDGRAGARHPPRPPGLARGRGARRAAPDRRARLAARLRGARPAGAQPRPAAVPRRRPRPLRATRSSTGSTSRARRRRSSSATTASCATPPPPRSPASSACGRRWTASASTWSCSAAARPGSPRRSSGGSEGLRTFVAEAWGPGGQAGTSSRIENYLGFPSGISGSRADPRRDAAGPPLRRGPVELPPGRRADRRPRGAGCASTSTTASTSSAGPW